MNFLLQVEKKIDPLPPSLKSDQREDWAAWGGYRSAWGTEDCKDPSMVAAIGCSV